MKLYLNETSPFSRVVLITVLLTKQENVELVWVDPWASPEDLLQVNPFSMIPTLASAEGECIAESLTICQYLIANYQPSTIEQPQLANSEQAALMGLAKTMMEIGFKSIALERFIDQPNTLNERAIVGLQRALNLLNHQLENQFSKSVKLPTLATLYLHCALDYIAFRHEKLFERCAQQPIYTFMQASPFSNILSDVSVATLANKPSYQTLL
ncbi:glutathione S-transferase [Vibrio kasasachensis]|uniref:glutathione S-transferase family protein n=1 Tax=Vibrio kasasachensis TaxID=2910248 RepID=UPI003D117FF9